MRETRESFDRSWWLALFPGGALFLAVLGCNLVGEGLRDLLACLGRSREGVDFDSIDGQPSRLFITLLAPEHAAGVHLQALARISRLFKNADFRRRLLAAADADEVFEILSAEDAKY